MKRVLIILVAAVVVVAAAVTIINRFGRVANVPVEKDRTLKLLTILGSAPNTDTGIPGRWGIQDTGKPLLELSDADRAKLAELKALPYVQGSTAAPKHSNVTVHDTAAAYDGVNLYNSGHGPEALAIDMDGTVLHRWRFPIENIWPDVPKTPHSTFWRRVHWYPNGDILVIFDGIGMIKLDKDSRLLWSYDAACHHQAFVADDGRIYVLTREAKIFPDLGPDKPVLEDSFDILSPEGKFISRNSILECVKQTENVNFTIKPRSSGDIFHTNSIFVFDESYIHIHPMFKKGNVLVSILKLNLIGVIEPISNRMVWFRRGGGNQSFVQQHDPIPLMTGNLLLFDNLGNRGKSRIVEIHAYRGDVTWQYPESGGPELFSRTCGTSQRLPNGNTLITESDAGRALEVTTGGDIVWEFYNPHRAGENNGLIATLFEVRRVDRDYVQWIDGN